MTSCGVINNIHIVYIVYPQLRRFILPNTVDLSKLNTIGLNPSLVRSLLSATRAAIVSPSTIAHQQKDHQDLMSPKLSLTPLSSLRVAAHYIPSYSLIPNTSPHGHPLLIYYSCFPTLTSASAIESHLPSNNITPQWRYTMYSTSHYHSTTHEILCIVSGRAKLLFGGEKNPGKVKAEVSVGDVVVVPAGVAHRLLEDVEGGFEMVGSYPKGCSWDMCYGEEGEEMKARAVEDVKWLEKDPMYGNDGPVLWSKERLEITAKSEL